jgi:hypothetical protein
MSFADNPPISVYTTDSVCIAPGPKKATVFLVKSMPRIGESIRVQDKRYRIKDIEHWLNHPQGHCLSLIVESDREIGDVI